MSSVAVAFKLLQYPLTVIWPSAHCQVRLQFMRRKTPAVHKLPSQPCNYVICLSSHKLIIGLISRAHQAVRGSSYSSLLLSSNLAQAKVAALQLTAAAYAANCSRYMVYAALTALLFDDTNTADLHCRHLCPCYTWGLQLQEGLAC